MTVYKYKPYCEAVILDRDDEFEMWKPGQLNSVPWPMRPRFEVKKSQLLPGQNIRTYPFRGYFSYYFIPKASYELVKDILKRLNSPFLEIPSQIMHPAVGPVLVLKVPVVEGIIEKTRPDYFDFSKAIQSLTPLCFGS